MDSTTISHPSAGNLEWRHTMDQECRTHLCQSLHSILREFLEQFTLYSRSDEDCCVAEVESFLYENASSQHEYLNFRSLPKRTLFFFLSKSILNREYIGVNRPLKRKYEAVKPSYAPPAQLINQLGPLFQLDLEIQRMIWSYIDGKKVIINRVLCNFAKLELKKFVHRIDIDVGSQHMSSSTFSTDCLSLPNLTHLRISNSLLSKSVNVKDWPSVQKFCVENRQWELTACCIASMIPSYNRLKSLEIDYAFLNTSNLNAISCFSKHLKGENFPHLRRLIMRGLAFGNEGLKQIFGLLSGLGMKNLEHMDFSHNFIGDSGVKFMAQVLCESSLAKLTHILLCDNLITIHGASDLLSEITSGRSASIEYISLRNNFINSLIAEEIRSRFGGSTCPKLGHVCFHGNDLVYA